MMMLHCIDRWSRVTLLCMHRGKMPLSIELALEIGTLRGFCRGANESVRGWARGLPGRIQGRGIPPDTNVCSRNSLGNCCLEIVEESLCLMLLL